MTLEELVFATVLFAGVSLFFVNLARVLKLGAIFGFLVAGIALGPHSPGPVLTDQVDQLRGIGELGVVLLMFVIGLEMQPGKLWAMRRLLFGLGPAQILGTGTLLALALWLTTSFNPTAAFIMGLGLALSSTAIAMQLLGEKGELATGHGKASFAVLMMQDIGSVVLLILIPLIAVTGTAPGDATPLPWWEQTGLALAAVVGVAVLGRYVLPWLFALTAKQQDTATFGVVVIVAVLLCALVIEEAGLSMAMAGFLLGVTLSESDFRLQVEASVASLKGVFMALFFVAVGMSIDLDLVTDNAAEILSYAAQVVVIKMVAMVLLGRLFGLDLAGALRSAALLAPCSEFGFVLFATTQAAGLISDTTFAKAVVVVSVTMAATPFIVQLGYWLAARSTGDQTADLEPSETGEGLNNHVVVVGYGRKAHFICMMLAQTATPYIAFDTNISRVKRGKAEGHHVAFGDITSPPMQRAAALGKAKSVVITLEDPEAAAQLVTALRQFYPEVPTYAAAVDLSSGDVLRRLGATDTVCTSVEGTLQLGQLVLREAGLADSQIAGVVTALRQHDYALIRGKALRGLQPKVS